MAEKTEVKVAYPPQKGQKIIKIFWQAQGQVSVPSPSQIQTGKVEFGL